MNSGINDIFLILCLIVVQISGMYYPLLFGIFLNVLETSSLDLSCRTDLPAWHDFWNKYQSLKLDPSPLNTAVFRQTLYDLVLSNHTRVLECNTGVIAGYFLIGQINLNREPELAYRSFQMAMIFVYTLRFTKQRIPVSAEIEWGISRDLIVHQITRLKSSLKSHAHVEISSNPTSLKPRIAIVSICAYPPDSKLILKDMTPINRKRYAAKHGYTAVILDHHPLGQDSSVSIQHSKLALMQSLMESGDFDWLMWSDCDSVIVNTERRIEDIVSEYVESAETNILITEELLGLSSANWIIRSSPWSLEFLTKAFRIAGKELPLFGDQDAIICLAIGRGSLYKHIRIIPQNVINAYDALNAFSMGGGGYIPGNLLVTFPQCQSSDCNVLFYEAFKASEDDGVTIANTPANQRSSAQLRVFGPPEVIGSMYFTQTVN